MTHTILTEAELPITSVHPTTGAPPFSQHLFNDYLFHGVNLAKGASAPDLATLRTGIMLNAFAGTGAIVEQGFFEIHVQHDFKQGTTPSFHVHWTHNQAVPSGDVKWQIDYSVARGYSKDTIPAVTSLSSTQTARDQYGHQITDDDDMLISVGTLEPDAVILGRIYRNPADPADTFEADASLLFIDVHYEVGQLYSTERNRPFTSGGFAT